MNCFRKQTPPQCPQPNPLGFTLIELLVVITIIVVLLSLLAPALDKAIGHAERAVCMANVHALASGVGWYRKDHRNAFPSGASGVNTYVIWGGKRGTQYQYDSDASAKRLINPYVGVERDDGRVTTDDDRQGALKKFLCPNDNGATGGRFGGSGAAGLGYIGGDKVPTVFDALGWSYMINSSGNNNDNSGLFAKRKTRRPPSQVVLLNDFPFNVWFMDRTGTGQPFHNIFWHHDTEHGWGNVAFVDGHVDYLQATWNEPNHQVGRGYSFVPN